MRVYHNDINNRNYKDLWFYSNPIWVYTDADDPVVKNDPTNPGKNTKQNTSLSRSIVDSQRPNSPNTTPANSTSNQSTNLVTPAQDSALANANVKPAEVTGKQDSQKADPSQNAQSQSQTQAKSSESANSPSQSENSDKLPETGEESSIAWFSASALSILAGLGLVAPAKKREFN